MNNGATLGRIISIDDWGVTLGGGGGTATFTGARLKLSESAATAGSTLSDWYIVAEGQDSLPRPTDRLNLSPEMTVTSATEQLAVKHGVNLDSAGIPVSGNSPLYADYKGLRLDVTSTDANPAMLTFDNATEMEAAIGPISTDNPLALAMNLAFLNSQRRQVSCLGISATSANYPMGTVEAYAAAFDFLDRYTIYVVAPLSNKLGVTQVAYSMCVAHAAAAWAGNRRMVICPGKEPSEATPTFAISGNMQITSIGGGKYTLAYTDGSLNVSTALNGLTDANGATINGAVGTTYTPTQGVYLNRSGDSYNWLITKVVATDTVQIEVNDIYGAGSGPGTGGNDDGFFQTTASYLSDFEADGETCTVKVRQEGLDNTTSTGRAAIMTALAELVGGVQGINERRLYYVMPESIKLSISGTDQRVSGVYAAPMVAAMVASQPPQQPLTYLPIIGLIEPVGSNDRYSEEEMATAAAGGVYWLINETGNTVCRHQLSTDTTGAKTREMSIVKAVDYFELGLYSYLKDKVGRYNVTHRYLEMLDRVIQAHIARNTGGEDRCLDSASLDALSQNSTDATKVDIALSLVPWYPCGEIALTLTV